MIVNVYTYVCEDCHAGWNGNPDDELSQVCRWCGNPGKLRGGYVVIPLGGQDGQAKVEQPAS